MLETKRVQFFYDSQCSYISYASVMLYSFATRTHTHCDREKVNHCIQFHNTGKQCQILEKFCNNNATSNSKQKNAKFQ